MNQEKNGLKILQAFSAKFLLLIIVIMTAIIMMAYLPSGSNPMVSVVIRQPLHFFWVNGLAIGFAIALWFLTTYLLEHGKQTTTGQKSAVESIGKDKTIG